MKLSFRDKGLTSFDASAVAMEANDLTSSSSRAEGGRQEWSNALRIVSLDISYNNIHTFLGARRVPHLETLDASHNFLREVMSLPSSLTRLNISFNVIESLVGLDTMQHLQYLDASNNRIHDLGRLPGSLEVINVSNNAISDTAPLAHLTLVMKLSLHCNNIKSLTSLAPLGTMKALRHITIRENPVATNAKLVSFLEDTVRKLTTLDGVPLSQAHGVVSFRAAQRDQEQQASQMRQRAAKVVRMAADVEGSYDAGLDREMRTLEARVKELEGIAKAQYNAEVNSRRQWSLTKQQLLRSQEIFQEQSRQLEDIRNSISHDAGTVQSLEHTLHSLAHAFEQKHALIVMKKLEK